MNRNRLTNSQRERAQAEIRSYLSLTEQFRQTWLIALIGCVGFICGVLLLIWNEGRAVQTTKLLDEAIEAVNYIDPNTKFNTDDVGKLVHLVGEITVQEPLTEVDYGVSVMAVKLKRRVQMYQWVEEESKHLDSEGNPQESTFSTFLYFTEWRDKLIDSSLFHTSMGHRNPKEFPLKSITQVNDNVKIGYYKLSDEMKDKFIEFVSITSDERPERKDIKLHAGLYYHTQDVWAPEVGDIRIQFSYAGHHGQIISIVALVGENGELLPFKSKSGITISMLKTGRLTAEDMFISEHAQNRVRTWLYRGGGWFLLYMGCICLTTILRALIVRSRVLREMLPSDSSSLKMTVSMTASLLVTAVAWMWYRPVFGLCLVCVTLVFLVITRYMTRQQAQYQRL